MAQIKTPTAFLFRWDGRTGAAQGAQISYFYRTVESGVEISGSAFEGSPVPVSVAGSAGVPLADIVGLINADSLSAAADLAAANATIAERDARIVDLLAQIAVLTPPPADLIGARYIQTALAKLDLANAWQKAIDLSTQALIDAKDPDPKRVQTWWLNVDQVSRLEPEYLLIVAQMNAQQYWGATSEAEMLALAREIQASAATAAAE